MKAILVLGAALAAAGLFACPQAQAAEGKAIVAYFSASGVTKTVSEKLSASIGADLLRIEPAIPYSAADLDWRNRQSRSSLEMKDEKSRPSLASRPDLSGYDTVYLGYPIWWAVAPRIINTFLESVELKGKTLIPFCTSGGSGLGKSDEKLAEEYPSGRWLPGRELHASDTGESLAKWARSALRQVPLN